MKYRKRPIVIEAEQWFPGRSIRGVFFDSNYRAYVITIHQQRVYLVAGDWVLPEPDGVHFYPCKEEVFEATYEPWVE